MPSFRSPREEFVAALLAPVVVALLVYVFVWRPSHDDDQAATQPAVRLDASLPVSPQLRTGRLSNQLRYFVQENGHPDGRAELRLVIDAGSVLEDPDQRGLAHAVEHMLFRGTTRFPGHAVDNYLQSIGMRLGSDVNASTSEDETIVSLTVPTTREGMLDTAIAILADMAFRVTFDTVEARQEAGVVMSEWRSRSGAAQRLMQERDNLLYAGSPYAGRSVIGDTAVLRRFDVGAMRRFYRDWYRPDLMSVVAVGDFDAKQVQFMIGKYFDKLPRASATARARPAPTVPHAAATRVATLRDDEATASRVALWHLQRPMPRATYGDYRLALIEDVWQRVLSERLEDAAARPGSPILDVEVGSARLLRGLSANVVRVQPLPAREAPALEALAAEVSRLAKFGVTPVELRERTAAILRERRTAEEWSDHSETLADGLVAQALTGRALVTRDAAYELTRDLLPTIEPRDLLGRARHTALDANAVVILTQPASAAPAPGNERLLAIATTAADKATAVTADSSATVPLLAELPTPGTIAKESTLDEARAFEWMLSNGMRVILKPTRFTYDDIEFRLIAPGGASLAGDADYPSAYLADGIIGATGVGPVNGRQLGRRLANTSVTLTPSVRDDEVRLTGDAAPRDLELLFQLLYLHVMAPRADTVAFRRYHERMTTFAVGRRVDPDNVFSDSVAAATTQHHVRAQKYETPFIRALNMSRALGFWKARMANAAGFTFVMSGDFTLDRVRPLVARYLASLPAGTAEKPQDAGIRFPTGIVRRRIVAGSGPKARTEVVLSGPFDQTAEASDNLSAAVDLAELALTNLLRERLGGTYDASVVSGINRAPPRYTVTIDFETSPERADSLTAAAIAELDRLRTRGPTDDEVAKIRATRTRDLDGRLKNNDYWADELAWHARMGWSLGAISRHQDDTRLLSSASLKLACATFLRTGEYVQVTMVPRVAAPH